MVARPSCGRLLIVAESLALGWRVRTVPIPQLRGSARARATRERGQAGPHIADERGQPSITSFLGNVRPAVMSCVSPSSFGVWPRSYSHISLTHADRRSESHLSWTPHYRHAHTRSTCLTYSADHRKNPTEQRVLLMMYAAPLALTADRLERRPRVAAELAAVSEQSPCGLHELLHAA